MKQLNKLLLTLLLSGAGTVGAYAEYLVDFDTPINTSDVKFIVAPGWDHKADYYNSFAPSEKMSYVYESEKGIDGTGALHAKVQDDGGVTEVYDYLITPPVKGTVTIMAHDNRSDFDYDPTFIEVYSYDPATGTVGDILKTISEDQIPTTGFQEFTLAENGDDFQCLALRLQHVIVDNFKADDVKTEQNVGGDDWAYTWDFNTPITTSNHDFKIASNWKHIVDYYDSYGNIYYMTYGYLENEGVDGSGALKAYEQKAGSSSYYSQTVYDMIVTPKVGGDVTLDVKSWGPTYTASVEVYEYNEETGKNGTLVGKFSGDEVLPTASFTTLHLIPEDKRTDETKRYCLRLQGVIVDNFKAEKADIEIEKSIEISSVTPIVKDPNSGTLDWVQAEDGTTPFSFKVKVTNNGDADLVLGEDKYSITISNNKNDESEVIPVPFNLAKGETSEEFVVTYTMSKEEANKIFTSSYTYIKFTLTENLGGSSVTSKQGTLTKYESAFVVCYPETYASTTSTLSQDQAWGIVTEDTYKEYDLRNPKPAPYQILSMELPEGFSFAEDYEFPLTIEGNAVPYNDENGDTQRDRVTVLKIGLTEMGAYSGDLVIKYKLHQDDENAEPHVYKLKLSGSKIDPNTWSCDFNNTTTTPLYPLGSFALGGVDQDYDGSKGDDGRYNNHLLSRTYNNTLFYTPLLHANADDTVSFDVKNYSASYPLKVYVTTDRNELGEPFATFPGSELSNSSFETKSITIPTEGNYYIVFDIAGKRLDNIVGLTKVDVAHDLFLKEFSLTEEVQNGKTISPSADFFILSNEDSADYEAKLYIGDEAVATYESVDLLHTGKASKQFSFNYKPEVENTIETTGHIAIEFTDGTVISTPELPIKITNEAHFSFGTSNSATAYYAPESTKDPIAFGTTNKPGLSKTYKIANWGTKPLVINSITVPEEFGVDVTECTIEGKTEQNVNVSFTTTTPGTYEGNLVISYNDGEEKEFTLPLSGTMLDPSKWFVTFNGSYNGGGTWPDGIVYQSNVSLYEQGGYSSSDHCVQSSSGPTSPNRMFITPLMRAEEGEALSFDVFRGNNNSASVKVYAAKKRSDLYVADENGNYGEAVLLEEYTPDSEGDNQLTQEKKRVSVTLPEAGEYYIGFEFCSYGRVDNIAGLSPIVPEYDLEYVGAVAPANGTQNKIASGTISINNYTQALEAGAYTVKSYVDGVLSIETEGDVEVKANQKQSEATTKVPVEFRSPKAGTYPVYFEFICGETVFKSEPVEVTFAEEVFTNDIMVGTPKSSTEAYPPVALNWNSSESVAVYPASKLGMNGGEKITQISYRGYIENWDKTAIPQITAYYEWVDEPTLTRPATSTLYDISEMTQIYDAPWETVGKGSESDHVDVLTFVFDEPIVYPAGKSLKLVVRAGNTTYSSKGHFEISSDMQTCFIHKADVNLETLSNNWEAAYAPVIYIGLESEPTTFSGVVTDGEDNPVADAVVTIISDEGDNIQYTGKTNENGEYSFNVIQTGRTYNVEVIGTDMEEFDNEGISFADGSVERDFTLIDVVRITDDGEHTIADKDAVIYIQKALNPGFNAVAFPMDLTKDEVETIFGEDVYVLEFDEVTTDAAATVVNFKEVGSKEMEAGKPYLIFADQESKEVSFKTKKAVSALKTSSAAETDFLATEKRTPLADKMFVLADDNFQPAPKTRAVADVPAYSGYIKAPNATSLTFTTDVDIETSVEDAMMEKDGEDVIYDLNGIRVKNPEKGIYIINGKAVLVK